MGKDLKKEDNEFVKLIKEQLDTIGDEYCEANYRGDVCRLLRIIEEAERAIKKEQENK